MFPRVSMRYAHFSPHLALDQLPFRARYNAIIGELKARLSGGFPSELELRRKPVRASNLVSDSSMCARKSDESVYRRSSIDY